MNKQYICQSTKIGLYRAIIGSSLALTQARQALAVPLCHGHRSLAESSSLRLYQQRSGCQPFNGPPMIECPEGKGVTSSAQQHPMRTEWSDKPVAANAHLGLCFCRCLGLCLRCCRCLGVGFGFSLSLHKQITRQYLVGGVRCCELLSRPGHNLPKPWQQLLLKIVADLNLLQVATRKHWYSYCFTVYRVSRQPMRLRHCMLL